MTVTIADYKFSGPYKSSSMLTSEPGVYVVLCRKNTKLYVIDVGESDNIQDRVRNHDRKDCWEKNCKGTLEYAGLKETNEKKRRTIEKTIRDKYNPPCGER